MGAGGFEVICGLEVAEEAKVLREDGEGEEGGGGWGEEGKSV